MVIFFRNTSRKLMVGHFSSEKKYFVIKDSNDLSATPDTSVAVFQMRLLKPKN